MSGYWSLDNRSRRSSSKMLKGPMRWDGERRWRLVYRDGGCSGLTWLVCFGKQTGERQIEKWGKMDVWHLRTAKKNQTRERYWIGISETFKKKGGTIFWGWASNHTSCPDIRHFYPFLYGPQVHCWHCSWPVTIRKHVQIAPNKPQMNLNVLREAPVHIWLACCAQLRSLV